MRARSGFRTADWLKFSCGEHVRDSGDERHCGVVVAVFSGNQVKVRWLETGFVSVLRDTRLVRVPLSEV